MCLRIPGRVGGERSTVVKLDLHKAFDIVCQSAILDGLLRIPAHPRFIFALAREPYHSKVLPDLWGTKPESAIPLERGCRQGAPESGLFFILAINSALKDLHGIKIGADRLKTLLCVDDIVLLTTIPDQASIMISDLQTALARVGLNFNSSKCFSTSSRTAYASAGFSHTNRVVMSTSGAQYDRWKQATQKKLQAFLKTAWKEPTPELRARYFANKKKVVMQ